MNGSRLATVKRLSPERMERELRLLNELRSENSKERDRAASALKQLGSESSRATLVQLLLGPDAGLAYDAAKVLEWSDEIRHGLLSPHADVPNCKRSANPAALGRLCSVRGEDFA
jgi:HEAT repeat protein